MYDIHSGWASNGVSITVDELCVGYMAKSCVLPLTVLMSHMQIQIGHLHGSSNGHLARRRFFPEISLSCQRYRDPDGLYNSLKEKASALLKVNSSLPPPTPEVPPCPQPATNETLLLMDDIEESGIPPAKSLMDLHASHPTCELEREMDLIAVRESVAAEKGSRLVGTLHGWGTAV